MVSMKVAIVHYWLVGMRGGERVLEALCELYPTADIFTHVYDPAEISPTITGHKITTSFIQKLPFARKKYQSYLMLMPLALEHLDLTAYDLVISSEAGPAKGVICRPDALHVCYCHSPMRYIWDQYHIYRNQAGAVTRALMPLMAHLLRIWDVTSAARVDAFVANSSFVAQRIDKYYRRAATVIHPPVDTREFHPASPSPPSTGAPYLYVGELVSYKRVDIAIDAFNENGLPLDIIGDGPEKKRLQQRAKSNITFHGRQPFSVLKQKMAACKALIFPGEEDFGIVPVEAMASGRPVIAYRRGGALDTVIDNQTGLFFTDPTAQSLAAAVTRMEQNSSAFSPETIMRHADTFAKTAFKSRFAHTVEHLLATRVTPAGDA